MNVTIARSETVKQAEVAGFHDEATGSVQYVAWDPITRAAAIIDPVLDLEEKSGATSTANADRLLAFAEAESLNVEWILDTHPHADHLSAADYLKRRTGARTAIGAQITAVQRLWKGIYNLPAIAEDGSQWDRLLRDGDSFLLGGMDVRVLFSPGHTMCSISYLIGNAAFIHDTLFMPDSGTARADFPGADPLQLWNSIQAILELPADTRLFTGHDYRPGGRPAAWESTVAEQRVANVHLARHPGQERFIAFRRERDRALAMPRLILHALQVNMNGGRLPDSEPNGRRYLKIPLNTPELGAGRFHD